MIVFGVVVLVWVFLAGAAASFYERHPWHTGLCKRATNRDGEYVWPALADAGCDCCAKPVTTMLGPLLIPALALAPVWRAGRNLGRGSKAREQLKREDVERREREAQRAFDDALSTRTASVKD